MRSTAIDRAVDRGVRSRMASASATLSVPRMALASGTRRAKAVHAHHKAESQAQPSAVSPFCSRITVQRTTHDWACSA